MSSNASDIRTNRLVFTSLMTCLVLLGTLLFRIPVPMTQGYVHLGDAMIYIENRAQLLQPLVLRLVMSLVALPSGHHGAFLLNLQWHLLPVL